MIEKSNFSFLFSCFSYTGKKIRTINLGSYNYLGFAENSGVCAQAAINSIKTHSISVSSPRTELGKNFFSSRRDKSSRSSFSLVFFLINDIEYNSFMLMRVNSIGEFSIFFSESSLSLAMTMINRVRRALH